MKLVIVESPHKAKTIEKYLGQGYKVIASKGHVIDLPEKRMGIKIDKNFEPEYESKPDQEQRIKAIMSDVVKADKVYLATDPDREGEAISWHLANICKINEPKSRIVFNEITKKAVANAMENPREIDMNLVNAQQARRVLDRLVGYEVSPIISRNIKRGLSAGRVQSVALKMIVDREREITSFIPKEYWNIIANVSKPNKETVYKCDFNDINGKKVKTVENKEKADFIINGSKQGVWSVDSVKRANSVSKPNPPFTTSTMEQEGSSKLGLTVPQVMQLAQQLYEGIEIEGEGHVALVTYIRTDSVRISQDAQKECLEHIENVYGKEYCPPKPNFYGTAKGAQDAHEAIRPITVSKTPESLKGKINNNLYRLYKLVYERFVASQMASATYDTLTVRIVSDNSVDKFGYILKGKTIKFKGYTAVYTSSAEDEDNEKNKDGVKTLPNFEEGEPLDMKKVTGEQKFTKPPLRYTEASFVKAMEENGVGRPSTVASILKVLPAREYIDKEGKYVYPTELGMIVCDQLVKFFPEIMDSNFTSAMEAKLDKIADGEELWQDVISKFYPPFHKQVITAAKSDGDKVKPKAEVSDVICDKCGARMVIRDSRYGKFLACPNFPKCRNTKPLDAPVGKCPKCGKDVLKRMSKKGKVFYGCTGYPDCDFISWDIPAPYFCPDCKSTMKVVESKKDGKTYVCTNKECSHKEIIGDTETNKS